MYRKLDIKVTCRKLDIKVTYRKLITTSDVAKFTHKSQTKKVTTLYKNFNIITTIYKLHAYNLINQVQYKQILEKL